MQICSFCSLNVSLDEASSRMWVYSVQKLVSATAFHSTGCTDAHLVSSHAVTVEESNLLILLPPHVVHTLVGLHIPDLQAETNTPELLLPAVRPHCYSS